VHGTAGAVGKNDPHPPDGIGEGATGPEHPTSMRTTRPTRSFMTTRFLAMDRNAVPGWGRQSSR
jgi:hypothetical protein